MAGGGIISTTTDLLKFQNTLHKSQLVRQDTLRNMETCSHQFRSVIYDGLGMIDNTLKSCSFS